MNIEQAQMWLVGGRDVMLKLVFGDCFDFTVVFKTGMCEEAYFAPAANRLIEGSSEHIWSLA